MLARFTVSVTVTKYGEVRWSFSQNNQCGNGKNFGVEGLYIFIYLHINADNFKLCDIDVVLPM